MESQRSEHPELKLTVARERRRAPRVGVKGSAMTIFSSGSAAGMLTRVDLVDASHTGLGVTSPIAVSPGTSFSLIPEAVASPRQIGIVVRCEKDEQGLYRLGLRSRFAKAVA